MITGLDSSLGQLGSVVHDRSLRIFERAFQHSNDLLRRCAEVVDRYIDNVGLPADKLCFVVVGSVGRREALHASDVDIVPVLAEPIEGFLEHDQQVRSAIRDSLRIKVSAGEDLTRFTLLSELVRSETIGGDDDTSSALTKRILILTEGHQAGGAYPIRRVREALLAAYADAERTSGRHVLSLCNDVARYYRTLCIEYKSKIDNDDKDWCTRNAKLRHCRKFWYFATMLAMVAPARGARSDDDYRGELLDAFDKPPHQRLVDAIPESSRDGLRVILENYAWFLDFMGSAENRKALVEVTHEARYAPTVGNPFPAMKHNSDLIQREMISALESLDRSVRHRVLDWFLL
jgi:hypothetical protein